MVPTDLSQVYSILCHSLPFVSEKMDAEVCIPVAKSLGDNQYIHDRFQTLLKEVGDSCIAKYKGRVIRPILWDKGYVHTSFHPFLYEEVYSGGDITIECLRQPEMAGTAGAAASRWLFFGATTAAAVANRQDILSFIIKVMDFAGRATMDFAIHPDTEVTSVEDNSTDIIGSEEEKHHNKPHPENSSLELTNKEISETQKSQDRGELRVALKHRPRVRPSVITRQRRREECDNSAIPAFSDEEGYLPNDPLARFSELQNTPYLPPYLQGALGFFKMLFLDAPDFMPYPIRVYLNTPSLGKRQAVTFRQLPLLYVLTQLTKDEIDASMLEFIAHFPAAKHIVISIEDDDCQIMGTYYGVLAEEKFNDGNYYPVLTNLRMVKYDERLRLSHLGYRNMIPTKNAPEKMALAGHIIRILSIKYHDTFRSLIQHDYRGENRMVSNTIVDDLLRSYRIYLRVDPHVPCNNLYSNSLTNRPDKPPHYDITTCEVEEVIRNISYGFKLP